MKKLHRSFRLLVILFVLVNLLPSYNSLAAPLAADYPTDPTADISWSVGTNGVADVQAAFNQARAVESGQLGISLPALTLPSQADWDALSDGEKSLWLINRERSDRGVDPLEDVELNVTSVAQTYADFLLDNDAWGHTEDGRDPWERLDSNPAIQACHDFLGVSENLAVFVTSGTSISLPIERAVYMWMYDDSGSGWGHRHAILWSSYTDSHGSSGSEGFLGIGRASGGPYQGPFSQPWLHAELIVMNVFDPCAGYSVPQATFGDVPVDHPQYKYIQALYDGGYTGGCSTSPLMFCPDTIMDRAQAAVFMMRGQFGSGYTPPPAPWDTFADDWTGFEWAEPWAEGMWQEGLTGGCRQDPLMYCPETDLSRVEATVFGLRMKYGVNYEPPLATGKVFADLTDPTYWGAGWAEQAYADGLLPECGFDNETGKPYFCPLDLVNRAWGAYLIVKAKNLLPAP